MSDTETPDGFNVFQEFFGQQVAAAGRNPNNHRFGPDYAARCQEWAQRDYWSLDEAANLLCGTDPQRPLSTLKGQAHAELNQQVRDLRALIARADIPQKGTLAKQFAAKAVIDWAKKKGMEIPPDLLAAMGHKPLEDKPAHGNALKNEKKRQQVLGAAIAALVKYPHKCNDRGKKPTGIQIATVLEQHQAEFFPEGSAPLSIRTMADLINEYLPK